MTGQGKEDGFSGLGRQSRSRRLRYPMGGSSGGIVGYCARIPQQLGLIILLLGGTHCPLKLVKR